MTVTISGGLNTRKGNKARLPARVHAAGQPGQNPLPRRKEPADPRQADLPAVRVAGEHQVRARLRIGGQQLRPVREHEGEPVPRLREQGGKARLRLVQALGERPVLPGRKARVVQAEERDLLSPARKRRPAVPKHAHAARGKARLQRGQVF